MSHLLAFLLIVLYYGQLLFGTGNKVHLGVTQVSQKVCPFPSKKCLLRRLHLAEFIATSLRRLTTYENQSSSFFGKFPDNPWIWLAKEGRDSNPAFTCPETSANRFSNRSLRQKSQFFSIKWNLSFTKRTLWSEENHQQWNKRPSYSLKGKYSFHFVHNTAAHSLLVLQLFFLKCWHTV